MALPSLLSAQVQNSHKTWNSSVPLAQFRSTCLRMLLCAFLAPAHCFRFTQCVLSNFLICMEAQTSHTNVNNQHACSPSKAVVYFLNSCSQQLFRHQTSSREGPSAAAAGAVRV